MKLWNKILMVFVGLNILSHLIIPHHHHDTWDEAIQYHDLSCNDTFDHSKAHLHIVDHFDQSNWGFQNSQINLKWIFVEAIDIFHLDYIEVPVDFILENNFISLSFFPESPHLFYTTLRGPPQVS
jgi:hypothetical protein